MMKYQKSKIPVFGKIIAMTLMVGATAVNAGIIQGSSDNFVAFEAETFDASGTDTHLDLPVSWSATEDLAASGGTSMIAFVANAEDLTTANTAYISYTLTFKTPGTYNMYARVLAETSNSNSGYQALSFDADPLGSGFGFIGTTAAGYVWLPQNSNSSFIITEANQTVTFSVKVREREFAFDRFIFSAQSNLTSTELDALPNSAVPEPTTLSLLGIGLFISTVVRHQKK